MGHITKPVLTEEDIYVIENIDREVLKKSIDFLKTYNEVLWLDNDTGEIVPFSELKKRKLHYQPHPQYPSELMEMGKMFAEIVWAKDKRFLGLAGLREEGFFTADSFASRMPGTMFSATLIASFICDAYVRERFCDGLFGSGVENGLYLKMLLKLEDLIEYWSYITPAEVDPDYDSMSQEELEDYYEVLQSILSDFEDTKPDEDSIEIERWNADYLNLKRLTEKTGKRLEEIG